MKSELKGKVVVVTGASAGLGRAISREFAKEGAKLGLLARGLEGLSATREEINQWGQKACVVSVDVSDPLQVERAASLVESELGPIDIWVNNAMVSVFSPAHEMNGEEYLRVTQVTYLGTVYGTLAALKRMRPKNQGKIIQVGSALAYRGIPLQSAYCGSKHAIRGFTDSVRAEIMHDRLNIQLSMVQMPAMNTPQFSWVKSRLPNNPQPVPPIYEPEIGAQAIVWVAKHYRREMKVGWITDVVVWGNKFFPGLGDRYLAHQGYNSQQTKDRVSPSRPYNLWRPVTGDHGARGSFDNRSYQRSALLWLTTHRAGAVAAMLLIASAVVLLLSKGGVA
jgi:NAD(P)-dependent dehydrogenase (short-subunit alcohol dehydrogenase family)